PVTEHVVDRYLTTPAVLSQEARLLSWARTARGTERPGPPAHGDAQAAVAEAVSGQQPLVLVVGPAGTGKTTALGQAAAVLRAQGRPTIGLAPSGKAADVLATETGWPATTLARLLHEYGRAGGPSPAWQLPAGA
ncbi:MAG: AAA family ATPase, partial [Acidimicrobiales bacterium]